MRDQVLWRKTGRIAALLAERLDIDTERALDLLYNSRTYAIFTNPESGLQLLSDEYILTSASCPDSAALRVLLSFVECRELTSWS